MLPVAAAAIGPAVSMAGGVIGYLLSMGDRDAAMKLIQQNMDEAGNIDLPALEKMVAEQVGPAEMAKINTDPALKEAQYAALGKLKEMGDNGGMMLEDRVNLNKVQNDLSRREASGRANITDAMHARGVGGSGAEFAMQAQAQSASADRANEQGMNTAATAQRRAYDAILARGNMSGDMRKQEWGEKSQAAQAQDEINRYNADARERAQKYNVGLGQDNFNNEINKHRMMGSARADQANALTGRANAVQSAVSGVASGASQGAAGAVTYENTRQAKEEEELLKKGGGVK